MYHTTYLQSLFWLLLSILSSCLNDLVTKYLITGLTACQICFFRFTFGSLVLVPIIYHRGSFKTQRPLLHLFRGLFLSIAMGLYAYSLTQMTMSSTTVIGFTNPIFVLILARIFLKEKVAPPIWMATVLTCIGMALILRPTMYNSAALSCILATVIFASLDIINKKYIAQEPILSMLFFSNLVASCCMLPVAYYYWKTPTLFELCFSSVLGIGSNLILYFLLKALERSDAASLAPMKYTEWVTSILLGYLFFKEWPTFSTCLGAGIIIFCTCFIVYYQNR
ncbi:DMT family transporter [Cardinium endosymbiont of Oedothorax gibbosus]|uniref:DMT family transporter n=1 Tax=Cardinium endosymbiont of Oedothorax gibbosus TaxID=931101 RepID=UPI0021133594|nr:DMT family transporter [Cardinium endosymbiont of Oedothorax gibbosus]CAH2560133.1 Putative S-adenosylmethionine uptake transporter [Cardinium endosymbiont of Oedothorax gibbosus]